MAHLLANKNKAESGWEVLLKRSFQWFQWRFVIYSFPVTFIVGCLWPFGMMHSCVAKLAWFVWWCPDMIGKKWCRVASSIEDPWWLDGPRSNNTGYTLVDAGLDKPFIMTGGSQSYVDPLIYFHMHILGLLTLLLGARVMLLLRI